MRAVAAVRSGLAQEYRFAHVIRVARFAERLASAHGEDSFKARLAGLFHDVARLYSGRQLIDECIVRSLPIDAFERANPIVLHARLGAELVRERFGITDEAILSAIRQHTIPVLPMSRLDVIVYLADALEPGREFAERAEIAATAFRDLHVAMRDVLSSTIRYLERRRLPVAPHTLATREAFARPAASV